jgi:hypothetical protein
MAAEPDPLTTVDADKGGEDVPAVLIEQHARIRELLTGVRAGEGEERERAFGELRALLAAHETAEEMVVRPVSVQIMDRDAVAARNHEERHIVRLLAALERLDARGAAFAELFPAFDHALCAHLNQEEAEEFPLLASRLGEPDRTGMARWIRRAVALGPTHAHPGAVGLPMAQRVVTPFTALLDHARDVYERARAGNGR